MGAAWKAKADVADLFASHATLELELASYRGATEALTGQIQGLQTALDDLGGQAALDPALQVGDGQAAGDRQEPGDGRRRRRRPRPRRRCCPA